MRATKVQMEIRLKNSFETTRRNLGVCASIGLGPKISQVTTGIFYPLSSQHWSKISSFETKVSNICELNTVSVKFNIQSPECAKQFIIFLLLGGTKCHHRIWFSASLDHSFSATTFLCGFQSDAVFMIFPASRLNV